MIAELLGKAGDAGAMFWASLAGAERLVVIWVALWALMMLVQLIRAAAAKPEVLYLARVEPVAPPTP